MQFYCLFANCQFLSWRKPLCTFLTIFRYFASNISTKRWLILLWEFKSYNLQYNTLARWFDGSMGRMTHWPSIWCSKHYFFIISCRLRAFKTLYFYFCKIQKKKNKKISWNDFCKEFRKKLLKQKNTLKIKHLIDESFVKGNQQISQLICRLLDF